MESGVLIGCGEGGCGEGCRGNALPGCGGQHLARIRPAGAGGLSLPR